MVACVAGSPKFHPRSVEVAAFLSEIINREIITGRYLKPVDQIRWFLKQRYFKTYTAFPLFGREQFGEQKKGMHQGFTYSPGSSWIEDYKGLSEPEKEDRASQRYPYICER